MTYKMKKEYAFWATVCLLLSLVPEFLNALSEEADDTDSELGSMKPLHTFCAMKADDGPCKAMIRSYFFNMYTHQCEEFIYGGCEGNENRFDTLEECKKTCIPGYEKTAVKAASGAERPDFCFLEEDPGLCRGYMKRYLYNNQTKQCERFVYGGCLGNRNNFETLDECKKICENPVHSPSPVNEVQMSDYVTDGNTVTDGSTVNNIVVPQSPKVPRRRDYRGRPWCLQPADSGLCKASERRFYYNSATGKCHRFNYTGCGGNNNNFTTRRRCLRSCKTGLIKNKSKGVVKIQRRKAPFVKVVYESIN